MAHLAVNIVILAQLVIVWFLVVGAWTNALDGAENHRGETHMFFGGMAAILLVVTLIAFSLMLN